MKTFIYIALAILMLLLLTTVVLGQGIPPMLPDSPDQTPIDGGLSLLAAAGGGYAIKKLRDRHRDEKG